MFFVYSGFQFFNLCRSWKRREYETKFVGNKTAIYRWNRFSVCLLFLSNSLFFVSFLRLSNLSRTQEQAGSMPSTQVVAPSPSDNRDGSEKVRAFDKRTHRHKPFDHQRFVSVLRCIRHAQLRDLVEVWALTAECSPPACECSPPDRNRSIFFIQIFVDLLFIYLFLFHTAPIARNSRQNPYILIWLGAGRRAAGGRDSVKLHRTLSHTS